VTGGIGSTRNSSNLESLIDWLRIFGAAEMNKRSFGSASSQSRVAVQTRRLIADVDRVAQIIESNIAAEEERAGTCDCSHPEYPEAARALVARRDNLRETITALEKRLSDLPADLALA
jgi:septation ring formation regulator EzrA